MADDVVRVAAVDCGTNSFRLLVADLHPRTGQQVDVERRLRIVRLGEGVDAAGRLAPAAVDRLLAAAQEYGDVIAGLGAQRVRVCATSAARDVGGVDALGPALSSRMGAQVEVISGPIEARLTALGARHGLSGLALAEPVLVVDIGGGSTELATLSGDDVRDMHSLQIGSVRLTERLMQGERASQTQLRAVRDEVDVALHGIRWEAASVVAVGGTAVTVAGHVLGVALKELESVHRRRLQVDDVMGACEQLAAASVGERAALACMHAGRADVIGAGALILERVLLAVRATLPEDLLTVSTHDLLDGIAWSALL